jgi:plasmid stabilization system protein ParE
MSGYRLIPAAEADIEDALDYTLATCGYAKYLDYAVLIEEALETLAVGRPAVALAFLCFARL